MLKSINLVHHFPLHSFIREFTMKWFDLAYRICRIVLGAIFIYAGITKLMEPEVFAVLIDAYGIVPDMFLYPVAIILPLFEIVAGIGIMFDIKGSLSSIFGLLLLFIAILGYGIILGLDVDCGCFGPDEPEAKAFHGLKEALMRDLFMTAGVLYAYAWRRYRSIKPTSVGDFLLTFSARRNESETFEIHP